jgi:predicted PurR-regulated permease PerM
LWVCYYLVRPFLPALAWSLALAIAGAPAHRWIEKRVKRPNLAATISVLGLALVVIVPATFVAERLVAEAAKGAGAITTAVQSGTWRQPFDDHPSLVPIVSWIERHVPEIVDNLTMWLTNASAAFVRGSVTQLLGLLLTFYLLFYFLRDRHAALRLICDLSPLTRNEMDRLFGRVVDTVNATIYGTVAVAAVQGVLGGLIFWWLGLPGPMLWGLIMALLAIVPVLGAFVVWIPAALVLTLDGRWAHALLLTAWGVIVVGGIDNLLYPVLVGNRLSLHSVPALISIIGGVAVFGPSGLILGPLAMAITASLLETWRRRVSEWETADGGLLPR